jgi:hypothetical protein
MPEWDDEIHPIDYDLLDDGGVDAPGTQPAPVWTAKRVIYLLIVLFVLIALLLYEVAPALDALLHPPTPPPIVQPSDFA